MFITVPTEWAVFVYQFNTSISFYDAVNQNSLSLSLSLHIPNVISRKYPVILKVKKNVIFNMIIFYK